MTLSDAKIRNGERPMAAILIIMSGEYPPKDMRTGGLLLKRNPTAKAQESIWAMTVAMAAPATPMSKTNINIGSRTILATAPMSTVAIPMVEKP